LKKYLGNKTAILLFILPAIILFVVMIFIPILQVFYRSMFSWDGVNTGIFIGAGNYIRIVGDKTFWVSNKNALIFAAIITFFQVIMATIFAIVVSSPKIRGRKILRVSYFIPVVLSVTVVCQLWLSIYNADTGLLNRFLEAIGISYRQNWLSDRKSAIIAIAAVNAWQWTGYQFALILAGIKTIPESYYEAARIDGASSAKAHLFVTIPLQRETYKFCLILSITGGIKAFTEMYIMTGGGPGTSTYTLSYMMYSSAFRSQEYGYGLTAASILVLECLAVILIINHLLKEREGGKRRI